MQKLAFVILLSLAAVSCATKTAKVQPPAIPEHEVLFAQGQAAFREATPEGYQRAITAFRKAASLSPEHCEYTLHLAQSLLFLATEQKLNQEDFVPAGKEAGTLIASVQAQPCAAQFPSILNRVTALSNSPGGAQSVAAGGAVIQVQERLRDSNATDAINRAIDADPNDPMNWVVLWKLSPFDSRSPLLKANALAPDLPIVAYEMGGANITLSHFAEARQNFERALAQSPRHFHSMIGLAYAIAAINPDTTETLPLYQKASDVAPTYLEAHALLGYYYDQIEETDKALEQYQTIVSLNPKYEPGQLSLGITLYKADRLNDAEKALSAALSLDSGDSQAHYYLASVWLTRADLPKAQTEAELAVRTGQSFVQAYCLLGQILEQETRVDDALAQYERAIRIKKDYPDALLARGNIRAQRTQFVSAIADFTAAIEAYRKLSADLEKEAAKADAAGFVLKARAQRRRKQEIEDAIVRAEGVRQRVQAFAMDNQKSPG